MVPCLVKLLLVTICWVLMGQQGCVYGGILDPFQWARSERIEVNIPWLPFENETRCYSELGCLNITRNWYHIIYRPFNVFPLRREMINTKFILYTRENPTEGQKIKADKETIEASFFDGTKPTKLIIHGFIDTSLSNWVGEMRTELLKAGDMNIIVVDWAGGSLPLYTQATANTRLVGLEIGHLLNFMVERYKLDPKQIHIIGHSLGAHTAAYAANVVPGLGRITGLDPAEPYYQGMPALVRLDPTDAEFVDVIHTDGKNPFLFDGTIIPGYGMTQPCGHVDFYPNNGKDQPGCDLTQAPLVPLTLIRDGLEEASRVLVACSHIRAIKLFTDSINSQCPYIGYSCPSYSHFLGGKCFNCRNGGCAIMGYHAEPTKFRRSESEENEVTPIKERPLEYNKYFLMTGREFPYCRRHYRITLELAHPSIAENWVQGSVRITMHGNTQTIYDLDLTDGVSTKLEHGATYSIVVVHSADLAGRMKKVVVHWEYDMNVLEPRTLCLFWCNDHLYVKGLRVDEMEMPRGRRGIEYSTKLCSKGDYADISSKGNAIFYDCD